MRTRLSAAIFASLVLATGVQGQTSVPDLVVSKELRTSDSWQLVVPASRGSSLSIKVLVTPSEWESGTKTMVIEPSDAGGSLGTATYTSLVVDKVTLETLDYVWFNLIFGIEREDMFPPERKMGRTYNINHDKFRQVLMASPLTVTITVNEPTEYGLEVTIGDKTQIASLSQAFGLEIPL